MFGQKAINPKGQIVYNTEVSLKYKEIDHSDIQNMAYLTAKLKHAVSGEDISFGRFL